MELRQLRSLTMLVESDFSVSRAASRLNLVQPAVSQHLKQLEEELGTRRMGSQENGVTQENTDRSFLLTNAKRRT